MLYIQHCHKSNHRDIVHIRFDLLLPVQIKTHRIIIHFALDANDIFRSVIPTGNEASAPPCSYC